MRVQTTALCCLALVCIALQSQVDCQTVEELQTQMDQLKASLTSLTKELMSEQFKDFEVSRNEGASGLKAIRGNLVVGTKSYYSTSYSDAPVAGIHDHGNNIRTVGMGEIVVVLQGVEMRTRHNDFRLVMKSTSSDVLGEIENIAFPEVPPEVLAKPTVDEQIDEMRLWFKAFSDQDISERDYRPHFKPVLCYLEGAWFHVNDTIAQEFFFSDRHSLDATTWEELDMKNTFSSEAGREDEQQNLAFLPKKIVGVDENGAPKVAQYNYRILCHPLGEDLPVNRLRVRDDIKSRMKLSVDLNKDATLQDLEKSRLGRYQLNTRNQGTWTEEGGRKYTVLDHIMAEIPGLNNYGSVMQDDAFNMTALDFNDGTVLNTANYHRVYKVPNFGAMGTNIRARSFNDPTLFQAMTHQLDVVSSTFEGWSQRWSQAIPLEIIYLTPLSTWNPLDIEYKGTHGIGDARSVVSNADGSKRTGEGTPELAYNGTTSKLFYQTPAAFYSPIPESDAPEDTSGTSVFVLDRDDVMHEMVATGTRVFLPDIPGVGVVRQRYPIVPLYAEGSATWKEMDAVKDILLEPSRYSKMSREYVPDPAAILTCLPTPGELVTSQPEDAAATALQDELSAGNFSEASLFMVPDASASIAHSHVIIVSGENMRDLCNDLKVTVTSGPSDADNHVHVVEIKRIFSNLAGTDTYRVKYILNKCDESGDCEIATGHDRRAFLLSP